MDQRTTIFLVAAFFANFDDELTSVLVTRTVIVRSSFLFWLHIRSLVLVLNNLWANHDHWEFLQHRFPLKS